MHWSSILGQCVQLPCDNTAVEFIGQIKTLLMWNVQRKHAKSILNVCVFTASILFSRTSLAQSRGGGSAYVVQPEEVKMKTRADSAWEALPVIDASKYDNDPAGAAQLYEEWKRVLYSKGLRFWNDFPEDKRKYEWLKLSVSNWNPAFWEDIEKGAQLSVNNGFYATPVNRELLRNWNDTVLMLEREYLDDLEVNVNDKQTFKVNKLFSLITTSYNKKYWEDRQLFLDKIRVCFSECVEGLKDYDNSETLISAIDRLFIGTTESGITFNELKDFVKEYRENKHTKISTWSKRKYNLLTTSIRSFALFHDSISANKFPPKKFEGKVVLVDLWNIYCSTCIERMPVFRTLFEKYHEDGFEVISVSIDPDTQKDKVDQINKKYGADWEHLLIGGKTDKEFALENAPWKKLWRTYGFSTVPQLLLFDKTGKLVMYNGPLLFGDPETLIRQLLDKQ